MEMRSKGWRGRPVLVCEYQFSDRLPYSSLTGSHRIAAAMAEGIKAIPVKIEPRLSLTLAAWAHGVSEWRIVHDLREAKGDIDRRDIASAYGLIWAALCLQEEINANALDAWLGPRVI